MSVDIKYSSTFDMLNQAVHSLNMCNLKFYEGNIVTMMHFKTSCVVWPVIRICFQDTDSAIWVGGGYELNMTPLEKH